MNSLADTSVRIKAASWGQGKRLEFIEFRLFWEGCVNRSDLVDYFGISIQQSSLDIAAYLELAPRNLLYDRQQKVYKASKEFAPALINGSSIAYLDELKGLATDEAFRSSSFVGSPPELDVVRLPTRVVRPDVLRRLLDAIRSRADIDADYQSLRNSSSNRRWVAPHALAFDGLRWHARSWCYKENRFRDFVLARFLKIHGTRPSSVIPSNDTHWQQFGTMELRARAELKNDQRRGVEAEYGMKNGLLSLSTRRALVPYFERRLNLDRPELPPAVQPLEWTNRQQFAQEIEDAKK